MGEVTSTLQIVKRSFRKNLVPGMALWTIAFVLLLAYLFVSPVRLALEQLRDLRIQSGLLFPAITTALFGGVIPFLVQAFRGEYTTRFRFLSCLIFYVSFWAWKGVEIDLFYQLQAWLWGDEVSIAVIAKKVAFDLFVFSAIYAVPCIAIFNVWKDQEFSFTRTRAALDREFLLKRIPAMIAANCLVWIPSVSVVYAMPLPLQVVMFNLILCFWVLVISVLSETRD